MQDLNLNNNENIILLIKRFIINQIEKERKLTQNKINILLKFTTNQIFNFLSRNNNFISPNDIKNIFDTLDIKLIEKIFEIYDKDKDSLLNIKEFYNFIYPKYIDINLDEIRGKNPKISLNEKIDDEAKKILYNILKIEIENLNDSSKLMQKIIENIPKSDDINIYLYLFELMKGKDKNYDYLNEYITINDIYKFLGKSFEGIQIYEQDIANFLFRYDYENNLKLNIEEFTNMINYFLFEENKENSKNNINNSYNSQNNNLNTNYNSFMNTISLSNHENNEEIPFKFNFKRNIDINAAINFKEKELRDLKINLLANYFRYLIKKLDELEENKIKISQLINSEELFSLFDINNETNINEKNFIKVFNEYFNIKISGEDFLYLIKKYDLNKDDKLNFHEFNFMVSPISKIYQKKVENKSNSIHINIKNNEQKNLITNLFQNLINCEKSIENQKKKLTDAPLYSCYEMFEFMRNKENKLLNSEDIFYFLKNNNVLIQNEQFDLLLNYLFYSPEKNKTYDFYDFIKIFNL